MNFNSIHYLFFLPIVFILHWLVPQKLKWIVLLIASYYFYMSWNVKYVFLILFTTMVTYLSGILMDRCSDKKRRKAILSISIVACLSVLVVFKYLNFIFNTIESFMAVFFIKLHPMTVKLLLPVGISFYTFQTLSYVIDVYRGDIKAEHHFGYYATFISFFPQLVAGPIERSGNLLPQIKKDRSFEYDLGREGLLLMAWGFFKKVVIADTLAIYADKIYKNIYAYSGFSLIVATLFFTIQIYCDFSGYSDIAIGTAKLFGIRLMDNFKSPYFSKSIKEFWERWHISLSTWLRDYIYIPLGGNRVSKFRHKINIMITFLVSGLWHGADWTFIAWGGVHGLGYVFDTSIIKGKVSNKLMATLRILCVFVFVTLVWVFFRAQNFNEVVYIFTHAFSGVSNPIRYLYKGYRDIYMPISLIKRTCFTVALLIIHDVLSLKYSISEVLKKFPTAIRWSIYLAFMWLLIAFMPIGADQEFIYFQF